MAQLPNGFDHRGLRRVAVAGDVLLDCANADTSIFVSGAVAVFREMRGEAVIDLRIAPHVFAREADELLMDLLGPLRSRAYLAVKRSEAAHFAHSTDPYYECFHHFTKL